MLCEYYHIFFVVHVIRSLDGWFLFPFFLHLYIYFYFSHIYCFILTHITFFMFFLSHRFAEFKKKQFLLQPRLGPKPFSMGSGDVSFDKVFAVPQAPGHLNSIDNIISDGHDGHDKSTESSDSSVDELKDSNEKDGTMKSHICIADTAIFNSSVISDAVVYRNGNNGNTIEKSDSLEDDLQRAISTAERRKVVISVSIIHSTLSNNLKIRMKIY